MSNSARIPYTDASLKIGYAYGQPINRYWVVLYQWDAGANRYSRVISEPFVNRERAGDYFRSLKISKCIPRVEIWFKLKGKRTKLMTYKGLE